MSRLIDGGLGTRLVGNQKDDIRTLTLARALVYKKRLAEQLAKLSADVTGYNSYSVSTTPEVNVRAAIDYRKRLYRHMIDVKLAIADASRPISGHILLIGELKAEAKLLKTVSVFHGLHQSTYGDTPPIQYKAEIRKMERDKMVEKIQEEIDALQIEIDAHNNMTQIEIPNEVFDYSSIATQE